MSMPSHRSVPPPHLTAASARGGCPSTFWIPPLSVVVVGFFLACLLLQAGNNTIMLDAAAQEVRGEESPSARTALATLFTPEVHHWANWIQGWAAQFNLDPNMVATVMQIESCGDPLARSSAGAMGLFQVMPYHFEAGENPYEPDTNARRGLVYLQRALQASDGEFRLAFAAYNGGLGVIRRAESLWPAETRRYVYWANDIYSDALRNLHESPRLQEWLLAGGAGLCRQARQRLGLGE